MVKMRTAGFTEDAYNFDANDKKRWKLQIHREAETERIKIDGGRDESF